jgi:hypothetical protein
MPYCFITKNYLLAMMLMKNVTSYLSVSFIDQNSKIVVLDCSKLSEGIRQFLTVKIQKKQ